MPTNPVLGEFVERGGRLYFIKAENLTVVTSQPRTPPRVGYAYLLGYGAAVVLMLLVLWVVVLFPIPLLALLIGVVAAQAI